MDSAATADRTGARRVAAPMGCGLLLAVDARTFYAIPDDLLAASPLHKPGNTFGSGSKKANTNTLAGVRVTMDGLMASRSI